jgi:predicted nucleic acid-binding protein
MEKIIVDATVLSNFLLVKKLDILVKTITPCTTNEVFEEITAGVKREFYLLRI